MMLNRGKSNILQLGKNNPRLVAAHLESFFAEQDLWVLGNTTLNMTQQSDLTVMMGALKQRHQQENAGDPFPLFSPGQYIAGSLNKLWMISLGLFSLEKRKLRTEGRPYCSYDFLVRRRGWADTDLCSVVTSERTQGNGLKLCQERFRLDIRKRFYTWRV
ncbi:hypothetical protein TURU_128414 [Turdus rufiventris]|nr:hypothetical protein TURU_128414 [Turdus rufiventris]